MGTNIEFLGLIREVDLDQNMLFFGMYLVKMQSSTLGGKMKSTLMLGLNFEYFVSWWFRVPCIKINSQFM
jgi:hypothetical protein